jgi:eukaryotic-like serine/threonine-protein kinase
MSLAEGTRLGPYEILAVIGAGGMGEVYRARDTRLGRTVAVKVLPEHLSSAEARQRFEREAKTISQLSHPHICALYDVGREGQTEYLVMELLEGEVLSERLARGALPLEQTLRYGMEIAGALDKAHRQGVVHRDLKPGNVMLTKSGVKLLDFGLAKAVGQSGSGSGLGSPPTVVGGESLTEAGTVLGTFEYMAPEQVEGRETDARTDIFALGEVLYQMATGRKPFKGTSRASVIAAIMKDEPAPISSIQPLTPQALDHVVRTCLAKTPDDRWQSAHDVGRELQWIRESESQRAAVAPVRRSRRELAAWIMAAALAVALAGLFVFGPRGGREVPAGVIQFDVEPPESSVLLTLSPVGRFFSLSPDGRSLALAAESRLGGKLWVRSLDSVVPRAVADGGYSPFWSPDGASIAFFSEGKLKKVAASGGPAITICDASQGATGTWGSGDTIVFSEWGSGAGALRRVSASGGEPTAAIRLDASRQESWQMWPLFLPDGRHFLYLSTSGEPWPKGRRAVYLGTLGSLDGRFVANVESEFAYAAPGFLLFARDGALFAQRLDPDSATVKGNPRLVAPEVQTYRPTGVASLSGSLLAPVIAVYAGSPDSRLVWVDRTGRELGTLASGRFVSARSLSFSPDGKELAFGVFDRELGTVDLWVEDLARKTTTRVTFDPWSEFSPVWSADGRRLFFCADQGGQKPDLFEVGLDDLKSEVLLRSSNPKEASDVSPDGRFLLYDEGGIGARDIRVLPLTGDRKPFSFVATPFDETDAHFSPDGRFVTYASAESGQYEIYVRRFPAGAERWQVSRSGGTAPRWSHDGKEIFFDADGQVMAAAVRISRDFESGLPEPLFVLPQAAHEGFEVAPDGRFLVISAVGRQRGVEVIANWDSEHKP